MTILRIKRGGRSIALLECDKGVFRYKGDADPEFKTFLEGSIARGIPSSAEHHGRNGLRSSVITRTSISNEDVEPYMLRDFLMREGYAVDEIHPEIEREIRALVEEIPDDNPEKRRLLEKLPSMTNLEQSAILEALREAEEGDL